MVEERWSRQIDVAGSIFDAEFVRRPFREGIEVRVALPDGDVICVAELGLGEKALLEKLSALLLERLSKGS